MLWIALAAAVGTVLVGLLTMRQPAVYGRQRRRGKSGDGGDGGATMAGADDGATCDASASCDAGGGGGD
ncbi:hypothetical protein [Tabrizicola sp. YIM 78059]|uniref:hypothetical protein n=1 Tax=Tabrizicola sp. YIM 78059 TaxID=2529861 RepID=UPI0010A9A932|nr:hypothetical protein [Tabrizicola sp. YIM 78059]